MKRNKIYLLVALVALVSVLLVSCQTNNDITATQTAFNEPSPSPTITRLTPTMASYAALDELIHEDPARIDNSNLPITPADKLGATGVIQEVDIEQYRLTIDGFVSKPLSLTYEEILAYPPVTDVVLLICPGFFVDNAEWTGVPVATILAEAGIKPEAGFVSFYAPDGYRQILSLEYIRGNSVFLAHTVNGQILPAKHGSPLRLVVEDKYGSLWVKWVDRIEVTY